MSTPEEKPKKEIIHNADLMTYSKVALITGVVIFAAFLLIAVKVDCPGQTPLLYGMAKAMIPLAAGLIGSAIPGNATFAGLGVRAGGAIVLVFVMLNQNLIPTELKDKEKCHEITVIVQPPIKNVTATVFIDNQLKEGVKIKIPELKTMEKISDANGNFNFDIDHANIPSQLNFSFSYNPKDGNKIFKDTIVIIQDSTYENLSFKFWTQAKNPGPVTPKRVSGYVKDQSGNSISGATVSIRNFTTKTNTQGYFELKTSGLKGTDELSVFKNGKSKIVNIDIPSTGNTVTLNLNSP
jgi:hypothetical protein